MSVVVFFWLGLGTLLCFVVIARIFKHKLNPQQKKYFIKFEKLLGIILVIIFIAGLTTGMFLGFGE